MFQFLVSGVPADRTGALAGGSVIRSKDRLRRPAADRGRRSEHLSWRAGSSGGGNAMSEITVTPLPTRTVRRAEETHPFGL